MAKLLVRQLLAAQAKARAGAGREHDGRAGAARSSSTSNRSSRHPWAWLLARVFVVDVTVCPRCAGPMHLVKIATEPDDIDKALARAGLGPRHRDRGSRCSAISSFGAA